MTPDAKFTTPRLGVLGSGAGSNFEALAAAVERGELHGDIVVVISDVAKAGILTKAGARGIAAHFVEPGPFKTKLCDEAQEAIAALLVGAQVDLVLCAGFMRQQGRMHIYNAPRKRAQHRILQPPHEAGAENKINLRPH